MRNKLLTLILAVALCFSMSFVVACDSTPKISGSTVNVEVGQTAELFSAEEGVVLADVTVEIKNETIATWTTGTKEVKGVAQGLTAADITYGDTKITVYVNVIDNSELNALKASLTEKTDALTQALASQKTELTKAINDAKTALDKTIADLEIADIGGLTDKLATLQTKADAASSIKEVKDLVEDLTATVNDINTALTQKIASEKAALQANIDAANTAITNLKTQLEGADLALKNELNAKINDLQGQITANANAIVALNEEDIALQNQINTLDAALDSLTVRVTTAESKIADLESAIANLENEIEANLADANADAALADAKLAAKIEILSAVYEKGLLTYDLSAIDAATSVEEIATAKAEILEDLAEANELIKNAKVEAASDIIVYYEKELAGQVESYAHASKTDVQLAISKEREVAFVKILFADTVEEINNIKTEFEENCEKIIDDYTAMDEFAEAVEAFYMARRTDGITISSKSTIAGLKAQYEELSTEAVALLADVEIKVYFADVKEEKPSEDAVVATAVTPAEEQPEDVLVTAAYAKIFEIEAVVDLIAEHYVAGSEVAEEDKTLCVGGQNFTVNEERVLILIDKYLAERKTSLQDIADKYEALGLYQYYMKGERGNSDDKWLDGAKAQDIVDLLNSESYANEFIARFVAAEIPEGETAATYNAYITALYTAKIHDADSRAWKYVEEHAPQVAAFYPFYTALVGKLDGSDADATLETLLTELGPVTIPVAPAEDATDVQKLHWAELKAAYLDTAEAVLASAKNVYVYGSKTNNDYEPGDGVYDDRIAAVVGTETAQSVKAVYNTLLGNVVAADYFAAIVTAADTGKYALMINNYETEYANATAFINLLVNEESFGGAAGVFTSERTAFKTTLDDTYNALTNFAKLYVIDLPYTVYTTYSALTNTIIIDAYEYVQAAVNPWLAETPKTPNAKLYNGTYTEETAAKMIEGYLATAKKVFDNITLIAKYAGVDTSDAASVAKAVSTTAENRYAAMATYNTYKDLILNADYGRIASDYVKAEVNNAAKTVEKNFDTDYQAALKFLTAVVNHSFDAYTVTTGEGEEAVTAPKYESFGEGFNDETLNLSQNYYFAMFYILGVDFDAVMEYDAAMYGILYCYSAFAFEIGEENTAIAGQITAKLLDVLNADAESDSDKYKTVAEFIADVKEVIGEYANNIFGTIEGETFTPAFDDEAIEKLVKDYVDSIQTTYDFTVALYNGAASIEAADSLATKLATAYALVDAQTIKAEYLDATYANVYADYLKLLGNITADEEVEDGISVPTIHTYALIETWMSDYVGHGLILAKDLASKVANGAAGQACVDAYEALIAEAPLAYYYLSEELRSEYLRIAKEKMTNDAINMIALYVANYSKLTDYNATTVAPIASTINTWFKILDQYAKEDDDLSAAMESRINNAAATAGFPTAGTKVLGTTYTSAYAAARALVAIPDALAEQMVELLDTFNETLEEFHNKPNTSTYFTVTSGADLDKWINDATKGLWAIYIKVVSIKADFECFNNIKGIADYNYGEAKLADAITKANTDLTNADAKINEMQAAIADVISVYTVANVKTTITTIDGYVYENDYNKALTKFKEACDALKTTVHTATEKAYNYDWTKDTAIAANRAEVENLCREIDELISAITSMNTAYFEVIPSGLTVTTNPAEYKALTSEEREAKQAAIKAALKNDCHIEDPKTVAAIISRMILTDEEMISAIDTNVALLDNNYGYLVKNNTAVQAKIDAVKNDKADKTLVEAWLASYGELTAETPAVTKAEALSEAYDMLKLNGGSLKTEKQAARIREQALALQNEVRTATKTLLDLKADLDAKTAALAAAQEAEDAKNSAEEAYNDAKEAYNDAKEAYAYTYTDGETTVYVFAVNSGVNGYDLLMAFYPENTVVFVSIAAE